MNVKKSRAHKRRQRHFCNSEQHMPEEQQQDMDVEQQEAQQQPEEQQPEEEPQPDVELDWEEPQELPEPSASENNASSGTQTDKYSDFWQWIPRHGPDVEWECIVKGKGRQILQTFIVGRPMSHYGYSQRRAPVPPNWAYANPNNDARPRFVRVAYPSGAEAEGLPPCYSTHQFPLIRPERMMNCPLVAAAMERAAAAAAGNPGPSNRPPNGPTRQNAPAPAASGDGGISLTPTRRRTPAAGRRGIRAAAGSDAAAPQLELIEMEVLKQDLLSVLSRLHEQQPELPSEVIRKLINTYQKTPPQPEN